MWPGIICTGRWMRHRAIERTQRIILRQQDALPNFFRSLGFGDIWRHPPCSMESPENYSGLTPALPYALRNLLNYFLVEPGRFVFNWLESLCYLGPLREIPSRKFFGSTKLESGRWATGIAAWDVLYQLGKKTAIESNEITEKENQKLATINHWISDRKRLSIGYRIFVERYRELPSGIFTALNQSKSLENISNIVNKIQSLPEITQIWLRDESRQIDLTPHEIGVGISQVLPVVVAAIGVDASLVVIEQPELHIHPAIQTQLGDLFITQSRSKKFLLETHSEHLLLRILRRIRETAEGQVSEEAKLLPNEVAVYYVESENGITQANRIGLDENGRFTDRWPKGFFVERMQEMLPSDIRDRVETKQREKNDL